MSAKMLWLALRFPHFALELAGSSLASAQPLAIRLSQGGQERVADANPGARRHGVLPGMNLKHAQLLCPELLSLPQDLQQEHEGLLRLAHWAMQFSSQVTPRPPRGVLLEIGASQRLFGGLQPLQRKILASCEELGHHPQSGLAPTPQAAWWLAGPRSNGCICEPTDLPRALAALPLRRLELPGQILQGLERSGLRRLGELLQLPRAGLLRRFGAELQQQLDRALGHLPDPQPPFQPPELFQARLELPMEASQLQALRFPLRRLLQELTGALRSADACVERLDLILLHVDREPSRISLQLLTPQRDPAQLLELWLQRLERERLAAPVRELQLRSSAFRAWDEGSLGLFGHEPGDPAAQALWERLQARLGERALRRFGLRAEHAPELALESSPELFPGLARDRAETTTPPDANRPLWLIDPPERLPVRDRRPWLSGPLTLLQGPERIETGWWRGAPLQRDYFIASDRHGARLWLFRQADDGSWYLQGRFG